MICNISGDSPPESEGHRPVLLGESLAGLGVRPGGRYVDVTGGRGGHAEAILEASGPDGVLTVMDRDPSAVEFLRGRLARFGDRARVVWGNFDRLDERAGEPPSSVNGILADLGVSSPQLDRPERGFSLLRDGPLDMRMDPTQGPSAKDLLSRATERDLEAWLREAGEVRFARRLARRLFESAGALTTTGELADAVSRWVPRRGKTHPATRVFLALRMAVNREMEGLSSFLQRAPTLLVSGGRLAVISFHSGEDRRVKWFGRSAAAEGSLRIVTKKPVAPSDEEQRENPRARSAKLRVFEKI